MTSRYLLLTRPDAADPLPGLGDRLPRQEELRKPPEKVEQDRKTQADHMFEHLKHELPEQKKAGAASTPLKKPDPSEPFVLRTDGVERMRIPSAPSKDEAAKLGLKVCSGAATPVERAYAEALVKGLGIGSARVQDGEVVTVSHTQPPYLPPAPNPFDKVFWPNPLTAEFYTNLWGVLAGRFRARSWKPWDSWKELHDEIVTVTATLPDKFKLSKSSTILRPDLGRDASQNARLLTNRLLREGLVRLDPVDEDEQSKKRMYKAATPVNAIVDEYEQHELRAYLRQSE